MISNCGRERWMPSHPVYVAPRSRVEDRAFDAGVRVFPPRTILEDSHDYDSQISSPPRGTVRRNARHDSQPFRCRFATIFPRPSREAANRPNRTYPITRSRVPTESNIRVRIVSSRERCHVETTTCERSRNTRSARLFANEGNARSIANVTSHNLYVEEVGRGTNRTRRKHLGISNELRSTQKVRLELYIYR